MSSLIKAEQTAVDAMPEGAMKIKILDALDKGHIDATIFRWPPP